MLRTPILFCFLLASICVNAQVTYSINGQVTDENHKPLAGATVFIDGSQIATAADAAGQFALMLPSAGSYRVSVKMLGYAAGTNDVILKEPTANINFVLKVKPMVLSQVNIGSDKNWARNFEIFKKEFLGTTPNALACNIVNPQVINFSTRKNMLYADADEFLVIENPTLGYRIKYLLKTFQHDAAGITSYTGDVYFSDLPGTDLQKQAWEKARLEAYKGSMMHFLRAVFTNTTLQEGFIANQMYAGGGKDFYNPTPVKFETLVSAADTSFISLQFTGLRVAYDPVKAAALLKDTAGVLKPDLIDIKNASSFQQKPPYESQLISYKKQPLIIDSRGNVSSGYLLSFLIRGYWTYKRVADQLPFEYQPPASLTP